MRRLFTSRLQPGGTGSRGPVWPFRRISGISGEVGEVGTLFGWVVLVDSVDKTGGRVLMSCFDLVDRRRARGGSSGSDMVLGSISTRGVVVYDPSAH